MEVIIILLPLALIMGGFFLLGFIWMVKKNQYEDLETPAHKILLDEEFDKLIKKKEGT